MKNKGMQTKPFMMNKERSSLDVAQFNFDFKVQGLEKMFGKVVWFCM